MKSRLIFLALVASAVLIAQPEHIEKHAGASSTQLNSIHDYLYSQILASPGPTTTPGDWMYRGASGMVRLAKPVSAGTWCMNFDGAFTYTWFACAGGGGGASPGGSAGSIQFNDGAGALGGFVVSGDGLINTTTGAMTILKTNGNTFAASSYIDTTNAANITSGVLPFARLPAIPGVTPGGSPGSIQINNGAGALGGFTVSGDAVLNTGTGVMTVTKTNGNAFAASAYTDTTNASNISSGTLARARLPNLTIGQIVDDGGAVNAYTANPAGCLIGDLSDGFTFSFRPKFTNTGTSVLSYCAGVSKQLVNQDGSQLVAGQLPISPISRWNHNAPLTVTGSFAVTIGDIFTTSGAWYVAIKNGTCIINSGCLGDSTLVLPINPQATLITYHSQTDRFSVAVPQRQATAAEAVAGVNNSAFVTPSNVLASINANAPLATAAPNKYDSARFTGSAWTGAWPATDPGSGRTARRWTPDGTTTLKTDGMAVSTAGCGTTATVLPPTASTPLAMKWATNGVGSFTSCYFSTGATTGPVYAGSTIKFDALVQLSDATHLSTFVGVVGAAAGTSAGVLSYASGHYGDAVFGFRFNPGTPADARWQCVSAPNASTNPTVVDAGVSGTVTTNFIHLQGFIDDGTNAAHLYIDGVEVCAPTAWAAALPAGSVMTPYIGIYQTASFGSAQTLGLGYFWLESN